MGADTADRSGTACTAPTARLKSTDSWREMLAADYLVVGAGLHSLAFVDELLAQDPSATFIIVDEHAAPGGHWNDACTL